MVTWEQILYYLFSSKFVKVYFVDQRTWSVLLNVLHELQKKCVFCWLDEVVCRCQLYPVCCGGFAVKCSSSELYPLGGCFKYNFINIFLLGWNISSLTCACLFWQNPYPFKVCAVYTYTHIYMCVYKHIYFFLIYYTSLDLKYNID